MTFKGFFSSKTDSTVRMVIYDTLADMQALEDRADGTSS